MKKNKLIILLNGGLGNQMFQYAVGRALAKKTNHELVLDSKSGFARDLKYKRKFELGKFSINARIANIFEVMVNVLFAIDNKLFKKKILKKVNLDVRWYGCFLTEGFEMKYIQISPKYISNRTTSMIGYWQSPRYFSDYKDMILNELSPSAPSDQKYLKMGNRMLNEESVSICIRVYEESDNPLNHSKNGKMKTASEINKAIEKILKNRENLTFFVFCTHRAKIINDLKLPKPTVFVTCDDGYDQTYETLWLLSQCRHHIITNSSFYWWGAWLSQKEYAKRGLSQTILLSDSFLNTSGLYEGWKNF